MQLKPLLNRSLRWLGFTLLLMTMLLVGTFGLLQTSIGLGWAGRLLGSVMSSPGFLVTLRGLDGSFPFDLRATLIEISDDRGIWLALNDAHLDIAAGDLLSGALHVTNLIVGEIEVARLPEAAARGKPEPPSQSVPRPRG